jgi:hypothetical protein
MAYVRVPAARYMPQHTEWLSTLMRAGFTMCASGGGGEDIVTVDSAGGVRTWQIDMVRECAFCAHTHTFSVTFGR